MIAGFAVQEGFKRGYIRDCGCMTQAVTVWLHLQGSIASEGEVCHSRSPLQIGVACSDVRSIKDPERLGTLKFGDP